MYATHAEGRTGDLRGQQKKQIQLAQQVSKFNGLKSEISDPRELTHFLLTSYFLTHHYDNFGLPGENVYFHDSNQLRNLKWLEQSLKTQTPMSWIIAACSISELLMYFQMLPNYILERISKGQVMSKNYLRVIKYFNSYLIL